MAPNSLAYWHKRAHFKGKCISRTLSKPKARQCISCDNEDLVANIISFETPVSIFIHLNQGHRFLHYAQGIFTQRAAIYCGALPHLFRTLRDIPPLEILMHRMVWALLFW